MNETAVFDGFPREALEFYVELAVNHDREWFNPRKEFYKTRVLEPAQAFVKAFGERLRTLDPAYSYDTRTNGSGSIMRIYRDTRFSKDKSPYKTNLGIGFWQGGSKRSMETTPGFYFHYSPRESWLLAGFYRFSREYMTAYRRAVAETRRGTELERIITELRAREGYEIGGELYKRVPPGYEKDHPRADLLRHKSLWAASPDLLAEQLMSPALVDLLADHARHLIPLNDWLTRVGKDL